LWVVTVVFRPINLYVIACTFLTSFYVFSKSKKRDFLRFLPCALFLRYGDLLAENCEFFLPHSHLTPSLVVNPFEFLDEFFIPKTRVFGLSVGEDFVILARVVFTQCQRVTDGRTDRQRDGFPTIASTGLAATLTPCKNTL